MINNKTTIAPRTYRPFRFKKSRRVDNRVESSERVTDKEVSGPEDSEGEEVDSLEGEKRVPK
jgi:hypothetical protein